MKPVEVTDSLLFSDITRQGFVETNKQNASPIKSLHWLKFDINNCKEPNLMVRQRKKFPAHSQ